MKTLLLCLDLGTSACKGALIDARGRTRCATRENYGLIYEPDGRVEQDPEVLWTAVRLVIAKLAEESKEIAGLSFSSQMSSHLLADADGLPLTRFVSWADRRAEKESAELAASFSREELATAWGAHLNPGPSWALPKLKWWRCHEPALLDRARFLLQPKDWILGRLCGAWVSDLSSLRGVRHQETGAIDPRLVKWAGFDPAIIPEVTPPDAVAGTLAPALAREWNLPDDLPVVTGWNDLAAGVLGCTGFSEAPVGFDLTGTSEHLGIVATRFCTAGPSFALNEIPFGPGHRARYGVTSSSGRALHWYWELFREKAGDAASYRQLEAEAVSVAPGAEGLLFLPCLNGERAPWYNPRTHGVFYGISAAHGPAHFSRAVLEGIAFTLRSIQKRLGTGRPAELRVTGGGAAMAAWNQMKADILGEAVTTLESPEAGCLGAAILGARALGWHPDWSTAAGEMVRTAQVFTPDPKPAALYEQQHARFEKLYFALEPLFNETDSSS